MKHKNNIGFTVFVLFTPIACFGDSFPALYVGIKGGSSPLENIENPVEFFDHIEKSAGFSLLGGVQLNKNWGLEMEYSRFDAETEGAPSCLVKLTFPYTCNEISADATVENYALLGVFKSSGQSYLKSRLGYVYQEINVDYKDVDLSDNADDDGVVFSVGAGVDMGSINVEFEQTVYHFNSAYSSIGLTYTF